MGCFTLNSGIAKDCVGSMGGIKHVWLGDYSTFNKLGFIHEEDGDVYLDVIEHPEDLFKFEVRKGSSSMTSTMNIDEANGTNYITTELQLTFARMSPQKRLVLNSLRAGEMYAVIIDNNGLGWFLGLDNPITLTAGTAQTGAAIGDANNYQITITDTSIDLPVSLSEDAIENLFA